MSEHVGDNSEDPMLRPLRAIAGSMGVNDAEAASGPYAEVRADAAAIIDPLPTHEKPIQEGSDLSDTAPTIGGLAYTILNERIMHAITNTDPVPGVPQVPRPLDDSELEPRHRSPGGLCSYAANHPVLQDRDAAVRAASNEESQYVGDFRQVLIMQERSYAEMQAVAGVLGLYGVPRADMKFIPEYNAVTFDYRGNTVRMSTLHGAPDVITDVVAWDARLSPEEGEQLWDDHKRLVREGAHLAHLARRAEADDGDITEAFNRHAQDVREHALSGGYRSFQVHTPNLRWGVPIALHLLEQPHDAAYDMTGDYSATNGFIRVDQPGTFTRVHSGEVTWGVGEDGLISPLPQ